MLNRIVLKGNMGRVPEIKKTQDGREIAQFFLATNTYWKGDDGKWRQQTDWHRITVFSEPTVKWAKQKLKQGDPLYIEGKLSYHNWEDTFGQYRSTPHIVISGREGHVEYIRSKRQEPEKNSSPDLSAENSTHSQEEHDPIPPMEVEDEEHNAPQ